MAKYSYEFKLQVVQAYLDGEGGYRYLSKKYGVPSKRDIEKWVFAYKAFGKDGLMRSRKNESYSFEFKLHVVELYLTTEVSYQELALSVGINNPPLIARWVNDHNLYKQYTWRWLRMENINGISANTATTTALDEARTKTKAYQDFINVLSQIIEKHGAEVLNEINSAN